MISVTNCRYYYSRVNALLYLRTQMICNLAYKLCHPFVNGMSECWTSCHVTCTACMGILRYFAVNKFNNKKITKLNECRRYVSRTSVVTITQIEGIDVAYVRFFESAAKTKWTVRNLLTADNVISSFWNILLSGIHYDTLPNWISNYNNTKEIKYVNYLEAVGVISWRFLKFWTSFRNFPPVFAWPLNVTFLFLL